MLEVDRVFREGSLPSDDLITTVLLLGLGHKLVHPPKERVKLSELNRTKASTNSLAHLQALPVLVHMRGGLDAIAMPGIADRIFW